jgi:hypothetical protein
MEQTLCPFFHLGRPTDDALASLAAAAEGDAPTAPAGMVHSPVPSGFRRDRWTRLIEHDDFDLARRAITDWAAQRSAGVTLSPPSPDIAIGTTLAFAYPVGPVSVTGTCRIVEVIDEPRPVWLRVRHAPTPPGGGAKSCSSSSGTTEAHSPPRSTRYGAPANLITRIGLPVTRFLPASRHRQLPCRPHHRSRRHGTPLNASARAVSPAVVTMR